MVELLAIKSAIDGLKAARDIAKTAIGLRDATVLQEKVIELNDAIIAAQSSALDAQADQLTLANRIEDLERQIASLEAWEAEKQRYELTQVGDRGALAYSLKEGVEPPEPPHQLCANCYNQGQKSILQEETLAVGRAQVLVCHRCASEIFTHGMRRPEHGKPPRRR